MHGTGTLINIGLIIGGGVIGLLFGTRISRRYQESLMMATGIAVLFIGILGTMEQMIQIEDGKLSSQGTMMMTISLAAGAVIGEFFNIDGHMVRFGEWLKRRTGNASDKLFVNGFVTATLTVCVGAMAIIGSIQDGTVGDPTILIAKGILDFAIVLVMTASMGKGCIFSAIPVGIFQGVITLLAVFLEPLITESMLSNISAVGSILVFCVGVNLIWDKKIRVANMLPALVISILWDVLL
ncbi:MAG: DUF554 domain-containing protein [Clostridiales bacterium]|nr:DUF554 domain-containing protein [Clostridiales bacterium]